MKIDPAMFVRPGSVGQGMPGRLAAEFGLQGRVMWLDAEANLQELSTRSGVADVVRRLKSANFNTIIVDVKPLSGLVLYASDVAPRLSSVDPAYPRDHDLLAVALEEGHAAGLDVHAAVNVFSEGSLAAPGGPALQRPEWQCVEYRVQRFLTADGYEPLQCSDDTAAADSVFLIEPGQPPDTGYPPDSYLASVGADGRVLLCGALSQMGEIAGCCASADASGKPVELPAGGFVAVATGVAVNRLKRMAESGRPIRLEGRSQLVRVGSTADEHRAVFVNPLNPQVRAYELAVVREICEKYPVDGIVLDRMRYPNIYSDFSSLTRREMERTLPGRGRQGRTLEWPEDVFRVSLNPGGGIAPGPLFGEWLKLRAHTIRSFMSEVRGVVKSIRPRAAVGVYVGSWFPVYYEVGVNWARPGYRPPLDWWPEGYEQAGYADLADYICTGCYYPHPTRSDAVKAGEDEWRSVEAAAEESCATIGDATFVYASLYLLQYAGRPESFAEAVTTCLNKTQGCMLFDLVYVRNYDWWSLLEQIFASPCRAPHQVPELADRLRGQDQAHG